MPIYEYECNLCRHRFDALQKRSDPPIQECERCQGAVRKLISAPPVILKGAGFYETEYGRAKHNHPDHKGSPSDSSDSSSSGSPSSSTDSSTSSSTSKESGGGSSGSSEPKKKSDKKSEKAA